MKSWKPHAGPFLVEMNHTKRIYRIVGKTQKPSSMSTEELCHLKRNTVTERGSGGRGRMRRALGAGPHSAVLKALTPSWSSQYPVENLFSLAPL